MPPHDASYALDRGEIPLLGLSEFALNVSVADAAPEGSGPGDVVRFAVALQLLLHILPALLHGARVGESYRSEPGFHPCAEGGREVRRPMIGRRERRINMPAVQFKQGRETRARRKPLRDLVARP